MRSLALALALALLAGCSRQPPPEATAPEEPAAEASAEAVEAPAPEPRPDDLPLPAADEVPSFLRGGAPRASPATPDAEPSLRELMAGVAVDAHEREPPALRDTLPPPAAAAPPPGEALHELMRGVEVDGEGEAVAFVADAGGGEAEDEPGCDSIRAELEAHRAYLRRLGAERDTYAYVASGEDAQALRLLASMRRCAAHPEDPDCTAPPMERDVSELEPPPHRYEREPSELEAEKKEPNDTPHDPKELELLHRLKLCERAQDPQPLLGR